MPDLFFNFVKNNIPIEVKDSLNEPFCDLKEGRYDHVLSLPWARLLFGLEDNEDTQKFAFRDGDDWNDYIFDRLSIILSSRAVAQNHEPCDTPSYRQYLMFLIAIAALQTFLQTNVTGPPLTFVPSNLLFPVETAGNDTALQSVRAHLIRSLSVDGQSAYSLIPHVELFCLADVILSSPPVKKYVTGSNWACVRINFLHQRLLSENSSTLQYQIYDALSDLEQFVNAKRTEIEYDIHSQLLLEKAVIQIHHGYVKAAREDIDAAAKRGKFEFVLTGRLGKRTKFQQNDLSQLVVLARSNDDSVSDNVTSVSPPSADTAAPKSDYNTGPQALELNDDTLLESIVFRTEAESSYLETDTAQDIPLTLKNLDPGHQPLLKPLDSIILLSFASSITNTSPASGLTREETLPYATRVLDGGSSNWQVYTQALLVRSRIEGYQSRTVERGLLQLQALVDQVIADTADFKNASDNQATTFLPRPKASESAGVAERLEFIHELATPTRWELEAELAARWASLGGMRTALEIYERLQMPAEAALCWAATDREDKAKKLLRRQLFHASNNTIDKDIDIDIDIDTETWDGPARDPPPVNAPRLYCILGDIDNDFDMYERAWDVSGQRYARAQRSLGRLYFARKDYVQAASAYAKSLKINQLHEGTWFSLGCAYLELLQFDKAAEAFSRTIQLDDSDAEAWSNLASALLRMKSNSQGPLVSNSSMNTSNTTGMTHSTSKGTAKHVQDALVALKRAARLKWDDSRIWDNIITASITLEPPPYADIISAQRRVIEIRGPSEGEKCIDVSVIQLLVQHVTTTFVFPSQERKVEEDLVQLRGVPRMLVDLADKVIVPLITNDARLWLIVAQLNIWRNRPSSALSAHEKAWRAATVSNPGWENVDKDRWNVVVDATVDLADAYETFGPKERTEGLSQGSGNLVAKDWKFKARSAVKSVMSKGKPTWDGNEGWVKLHTRLEQL